jgi:hypothetical protein
MKLIQGPWAPRPQQPPQAKPVKQQPEIAAHRSPLQAAPFAVKQYIVRKNPGTDPAA